MKPTLVALLALCLAGCGKKTEPKAESEQPPKSPKKEPTYVWYTPTSLSLYATVPIEDETDKAFTLQWIADALYEGGDKEGALANWKHAMRLAQKIDEKEDFGSGLKSKARLLTNIGSGLAKAGNKKQARAVLKQLVEVVAKSEKRNSPWELYLLEEVITELIDAGNAELTIEQAQQIKNTTFRAIALFYIAKAQAKAGNKQQMVKTLNQTIEAIEKIKKVEGAYVNETDQQLVLITQEYKDSALAYISIILAKAGEFKHAMEIALKIRDEEALAGLLDDNIRETVQRHRDVAQIATFLKQAAEIAQEFKDARTKARMLEDIARDLTEVGAFKQAMEIALKIENAEDRAYALSHIAKAKQIASTPPTAGGTKKALELVQTLEGNKNAGAPAVDVLFGGVKKALEEALKIEDAESKANALSHIMYAEAGRNRDEWNVEWKWWFNHRPEQGGYVASWNAESFLLREGKFKLAIEVAQSTASGFYEIVSALVNSGDNEGALENLQLAVKAAQDLFSKDKVRTLSTIAWGFDAIGEKEQALSTFRLAIEEAMELRDEDKLYAARIIAEDMATESVPNKKDKMGHPVYRMKKTFSAEEKKIANQLGKILQPFVIKSVARKVEQRVTDMGKAPVEEGPNNKANESNK